MILNGWVRACYLHIVTSLCKEENCLSQWESWGRNESVVRKAKMLMNLTSKENKTTVSEEKIRKPTPFQKCLLENDDGLKKINLINKMFIPKTVCSCRHLLLWHYPPAYRYK